MNYMSAKEAAALWGVSQRRVVVLCPEQRIHDAEMVDILCAIRRIAYGPQA